jgi:hypothetical protein
MSELDEEELLESIRKNREIREVRREAVESLRLRAKANMPAAVVQFVMGIGILVAHFLMESVS